MAAVAEKHHEIPLHQYLTSNTYQPRITSLQVRQEKEAELRANDLHWQKRICQLEETHQKINQLMEQEYNCAVSIIKRKRYFYPLESSALSFIYGPVFLDKISDCI